MAITQYYDVSCNICEKEFDPKLGGIPLESLDIAEKRGWLIVYKASAYEPLAAICPECWDWVAGCQHWRQPPPQPKGQVGE